MRREHELEIKKTVIDLVRDYYSDLSIRKMNGIDRAHVARDMARQLDGPDAGEVLDYLEYILPKAYLASLSGWIGDPEKRRIDPWINRHLTQWSFQSAAAVKALTLEARPFVDPLEVDKWIRCSMEQLQSPERKD